jgi:hypothetical protein
MRRFGLLDTEIELGKGDEEFSEEFVEEGEVGQCVKFIGISKGTPTTSG